MGFASKWKHTKKKKEKKLTGSEELSNSHLEIHKGDSLEHQTDHVRDQEGTSTVFVAQVWEPPDISKTNGQANTSQQIFDLIAPRASLVFLFRFQCYLNRDLISV